MVALIVVAGAVTFWNVTRHTDAQEMRHLSMLAGLQARSVSAQVGIFRAILVQLAAGTEVRDLLAFGDPAAATDWARRTRPMLPGAVGLALVLPTGQVLGNPLDQRVGPRCQADLSHLAQAGAAGTSGGPIVHRDNPALAHFDLVTEARDDGGRLLGMLMASFSLDSLARHLEPLAEKDMRLEIRDADGSAVAAVGSPDLHDDARESIEVAVPDTPWVVTVFASGTASRESGHDIAVTAAVVSVAVVLAVTLLIAYITRLVVAEFRTVQEMLERIGEVEDTGSLPRPRLRETAQLVQAIGGLTREIHSQQRTLETMSLTDELTGLANRRRFSDSLREGYGLASRGRSVCVALIDVDGFKAINDRYGHHNGDRCLQFIGQQLSENVRRSDLAARLGGDEFALVLYGLERDDAMHVLEKLLANAREAFAADELSTVTGTLALSLGLSCVRGGEDESEANVLYRADEALYAAKRAGGNRIEVA